MDSDPRSEPAAPASPAGGVQATVNAGSLGVALGFGITAAVLLSPIFVTSFVELLGRALFLSMLLLLVFVGAQRLPERRLPRWLPRWLFTVLAVGLAAPLGTLAIYLVSVGGRVGEFVRSEPRITGFVVLSLSALVLGLIITLTAQLREREARARSLALQLELERSRLEKQTADARLALLQGQIEPHFLFNTLANVQALVESGSPQAGAVLKSLTAYLRAALPRLHDEAPTLARELELLRAYLELMRMRLPDRLQYTLRADPALLALPLPPLALLTLVENAVRHGIDPAEAGGEIEVGAEAADGLTRLWVADSGIGLQDGAAAGTGLANLRARLAGFYGGRAELVLKPLQPHGLRAEILIRP